jgi:hypothetical protein
MDAVRRRVNVRNRTHAVRRRRNAVRSEARRTPQKARRTPRKARRTPRAVRQGERRMTSEARHTPQEARRTPREARRTPRAVRRTPRAVRRTPQEARRTPRNVQSRTGCTSEVHATGCGLCAGWDTRRSGSAAYAHRMTRVRRRGRGGRRARLPWWRPMCRAPPPAVPRVPSVRHLRHCRHRRHNATYRRPRPCAACCRAKSSHPPTIRAAAWVVIAVVFSIARTVVRVGGFPVRNVRAAGSARGRESYGGSGKTKRERMACAAPAHRECTSVIRPPYAPAPPVDPCAASSSQRGGGRRDGNSSSPSDSSERAVYTPHIDAVRSHRIQGDGLGGRDRAPTW